MATREQIVSTARSYMNVRWHHQGRSRAGLDCVGLVLVTAWDLGLSDIDYDGYGRVPDGKMLRAELEAHLDQTNNPSLGDVLLMRFDRQPQHLAIVSDIGIIHAHAAMRKVVEHGLDDAWSSRIVGAYSWRGIV